MTSIFKGMMQAKAGKVGGFFSEVARNILNQALNSTPATNTANGGFDLLAWNINRGRDHGLPRNLQLQQAKKRYTRL